MDVKLFVPGQNLNGVMIPSTGEYNAEPINNRALVDRFNTLAAKKLLKRHTSEEATHELLAREDQIVCVKSSDSAKHNTEESMIQRLSSLAIQKALDNHETQEFQAKQNQSQQKSSKWVFSASVHLSLTKETTEEGGSMTLPLDDGRRGQQVLQDYADNANAIEEEGVEVVSYLLSEERESCRDHNNFSSENDYKENERVSVLYVMGDDNAMVDID